MKIRWKRKHERVYFGYRGDDDQAMIFGSPRPMAFWCSVVWFKTPRFRYEADYHTRLSDAKQWAENRLREATA